MKKQVKGYLKTTTQTIKYDNIAIWNQEEEQLKWKESDALQTLFILDFKNHEIIRENKELKMILTFDKKKDTIMNCKFKDINQEILFSIKIKEYRETKEFVYLSYETLQNGKKIEQFTLEVTFQ